jgi:hypothetical protein
MHSRQYGVYRLVAHEELKFCKMHQGTHKGADIYFNEEKHNLTSALFTRISNGYRHGKTLCF